MSTENAFLIRTETDDHGTFGYMLFSGNKLRTLEPPWRDNKNNISCIPAGRYHCRPWLSKRFGNVFVLEHVEGRNFILTHTGNWGGDKSKGYKTNTQGCILIGRTKGVDNSGQKAIWNSGLAFRQFKREMNPNGFDLYIIDGVKLC